MHQLDISGNLNTTAAHDVLGQLPNQPVAIPYQGAANVDLTGGHMQGVQLYTYQGINYAFISGSTHHFAYLQIVQFAQTGNQLIATHILHKGKLRHAGGFQIHDNYLAIGLEDNIKKDYSTVNIYEINNPASFDPTPIVSIERKGKRKRSTAGCLGFTQFQDQWLLVVGDWNTRHLDFYACKLTDWKNKNYQFKLFDTITPKKIDQTNWLERKWRTYQNINLLTDERNNTLYLIGFDGWFLGKDVADLYTLKIGDQIALKKIASKKFNQNKGSKFIWGAGAFLLTDGRIGILSCSFRSKARSFLSVYL